MTYHTNRVIVVERRADYVEPTTKILKVQKMAFSRDSGLPVTKTEEWPIHTIHHFIDNSQKRRVDPWELDMCGPYDGTRIAIDPALDPILALYYRASVERERAIANKKVEQLNESARVMGGAFQQERAWSKTLLARIDRFNGLSFWAKVKWVLKGKEI